MTTPTDNPPAPASDLQAELLASGAAPVTVDAEALLAQIKALTARVQAMEAEKGIPSDPIKAALNNLVSHVEARASQYPNHDFSELHSTLTTLPEQITQTHTALVKSLVEGVVAQLKHAEISYFPELARNLEQAVLKTAVGSLRNCRRG